MSSRRQRLISPPPQTPLAASPALSAIRPSPLSSTTLPPYAVTASSFTSSPTLSSVTRVSAASPDYFDEFTYSSDMEDDFRRIDRELILASDSDGDNDNDAAGQHPPEPRPMRSRNKKHWVVFRGKTPGIYEDGLSAALQTQVYSDGFQRMYQTFDAAEADWNAFLWDGSFPDYGKSPWVVFLGRRPGVFTRVTELEGCVRGYENAIFQSCASVAEGNIKFQIFIQRVVEMFKVPDLFSGVDTLMLQRQEGGGGTTSISQPTIPVQVVLTHSQHSTPVAESSKAASKRRAVDPPPSPPPQKSKLVRPGDGWYVVHTGVLPGVYYGAIALKNAKPSAGGFICAASQAEADQLFLELTINSALVFVRE